jgi:predicted hydrolase (HD superfamily)
VIEVVASHADHLGEPRDTPVKKTLAAVDELTGFIAACAFVRPTRAVLDVTPQAVRKKMKDKAFARAVDRQAMLDGAELLGIPFDEHVEFVIAAMAENAEELGLQGVAAE